MNRVFKILAGTASIITGALLTLGFIAIRIDEESTVPLWVDLLFILFVGIMPVAVGLILILTNRQTTSHKN